MLRQYRAGGGGSECSKCSSMVARVRRRGHREQPPCQPWIRFCSSESSCLLYSVHKLRRSLCEYLRPSGFRRPHLPVYIAKGRGIGTYHSISHFDGFKTFQLLAGSQEQNSRCLVDEEIKSSDPRTWLGESTCDTRVRVLPLKEREGQGAFFPSAPPLTALRKYLK